MRLRHSFLSKMITIAILSASGVPSFANDTFATGTALTEDQYKEKMAEWAKEAAHNVNQQYHLYKKFENSIVKSPQTSLDQIINKFEHVNSQNDTFDQRVYSLALRYSQQLPTGEFSTIELNEGAKGKAAMTLVVHEKARTNPFVLLEAFLGLDSIIPLKTIGGATKTLKPGANVLEHADEAYVTKQYKLTDALGIALPKENLVQDKIIIHPAHYVPKQKTPSLTLYEKAELSANAAAGSVLSQRKLAELNSYRFAIFKNSLTTFSPLNSMRESTRIAALQEYAKLKGLTLGASSDYQNLLSDLVDQMDFKNKRDLEALNAAAKKAYKQQIEEYKSGASERENIVASKSLSDMVKANDRAGVADAMEKMLPWSIMEPTEKVFWSDYVDAIRNPNYDGASILFRGLDDQEKLQSVIDGKGKVVGGGMFSKRLTAGSGSHLFKLKGLPETFETFGTMGAITGKRTTPLNEPHTLSRMMMNHAADPKGSPFISLTLSLDVAYQFGAGAELVSTPADLAKATEKYLNSNASGGIATIRIDKRRLLTNSVSRFSGEVEVLASMLIFPDEVLLLEKGVEYSIKDPTGQTEPQRVNRIPRAEYYKKARAIVYQKTGINLPETAEALADTGNAKYFNGLKDLQDKLTRANPNAPRSCSKIFQ